MRLKLYGDGDKNLQQRYASPSQKTMHRFSLLHLSRSNASPCTSLLNHFLFGPGLKRAACAISAVGNAGDLVGSVGQ